MSTVTASAAASADSLRAFIARVLHAVGMGTGDAATVAQLMADADLRGADTHGVFRLPAYVKRMRAGGMNLAPNIHVVQERAASAEHRVHH